MTKVIVFDIDGTLANIEHRRSFVATKPKNWKAFNAGIVNDTPHEDLVELTWMFHSQLHQVTSLFLINPRAVSQHVQG